MTAIQTARGLSARCTAYAKIINSIRRDLFLSRFDTPLVSAAARAQGRIIGGTPCQKHNVVAPLGQCK